MATVKQIIQGSLRAVNVLAAGEEPSPGMSSDAQLILKQMLDSWSNETLLINALVHESFSLTATQSYTVGDGGDFDTVRPTLINSLRISVGSTSEHTVELTDLRDWQRLDSTTTNRTYPRKAYYEASYPLGKLYFSAIPENGGTLQMVSTKPISDLPALTAEMEFPPGYERAIRLGLALELAPEYGGQANPLIIRQFQKAINGLKRINSNGRTPAKLQVDSMLQGPGS